jgi:ribosomal protein S18 acetylase RimI-like enzyme
VVVRQAGEADLEAVAGLFDLYRQFYRQPSDLERARSYISERMTRRDSVVLVAQSDDGRLTGFCQLYPTYCSLRTARTFVLYDLYVASAARGQGVGRALIRAAEDYARAAGAVRLELSTARDNTPAQRLYESLGWKRDEDFFVYGRTLMAEEREP